MMELSGGQLTIVAGAIALLVPCFIFMFSGRTEKYVILLFSIYLFVVAYETLFVREIGIERHHSFIPFITYFGFSNKYTRYQVYNNIFLFIPLGFLIPFSSKKTFFQTFLIGLCLSVTIETLQYIFALGLCETDDVIHNTLGCIIGYWYWFGLSKLSEKIHRDTER